jgi:hypothetical protein
MANTKRNCYTAGMEEGRKRVLLIAASILAARKLAQYDGGPRVPATVSTIADAIRWTEEIMRTILTSVGRQRMSGHRIRQRQRTMLCAILWEFNV